MKKYCMTILVYYTMCLWNSTSYGFSEIFYSMKMYNYYGKSKSILLLTILLSSIMPPCRTKRHREVTIIYALLISDDPQQKVIGSVWRTILVLQKTISSKLSVK